MDFFGLLAEVIVFQPVGQGASSFGHTATHLNGLIYSYGPSGMHIEPIHLYMARNNFRGAAGYVIPLTKDQETKLTGCLSSYNKPYRFPINACADPLQSCLQSQGLPLKGVFGNEVMTPAGLLYSIPMAFPGGQFVYYPAIR